MKLYIVTMELETVVYAESPDDACRIAADDAEEAFDVYSVSSTDLNASEAGKRLPWGWGADSIPFGGTDDRTIAEIRADKERQAIQSQQPSGEGG